jgi:hypothetical protein
MTIETLTAFFGWCALINIGLMLLTTVTLLVGHESIIRIHSRMFGLEKPELQRAYFQYLAQFKIAVLVFSIVPYIALKMIG